MAKKEEKADITYEQAVLELESVVNMLESGDLPLEESIKIFEKGISLVRLCNKKLDDIEKRITLLIEGKEGIIEKDFSSDDL
ncbi:MAG: exodeoxyribonuclease VII small subunit [Clostridiaceae bacterium]|jgi:exodeoxyribonuclease VII small subunit|nr:exodeoxyribonuclease VII small subunit [Clostridiaceae bacterium]